MSDAHPVRESAMPRKVHGLPKGLQNKPAGSENWYQLFYSAGRSPSTKWVRLKARTRSRAETAENPASVYGFFEHF